MITKPTKALCLLFALFISACQQTPPTDPIPEHDLITIDSKVLNEKRVITVWTPPKYDKTINYPVIYMPDGGVQEDFPHIANTIAQLVENGEIAPLLLVGIENTVRRRDLTGPSSLASDAEIAPIMDPSLWWDNHQLAQTAVNRLLHFTDKPMKIWFAGSDATDIHQHTEALKDAFENNAPETVDWYYSPQPEEHHNTIFRATKVSAFKWSLWK